jgi:cell division septation protein DedD
MQRMDRIAMRMQQERLTFSSMVRYLTLLLMIATCYGQESSNSWLDIVLEKSETPQNKEVSINTEDDTTYFTIQVAARSTFPEAMRVIKELNKLDFDAFIQKNDSNPKARYRIRYGNFSSKEDANKVSEIIKEKLGYECWIDRIEL